MRNAMICLSLATGLLFSVACDPSSPPADTEDTDTTPDADCREIDDGRVICFPWDHICYDPHGIGDGVPIETDCWTGGSRLCNWSQAGWPECNGGWEGEQ